MDTDAHSSFATLLKEHRLAIGLCQEALAERAGLSREAISLLERGAAFSTSVRRARFAVIVIRSERFVRRSRADTCTIPFTS